MVNIHDFFDKTQWQKITNAGADMTPPYLVIDLNVIKEKYQQLARSFGSAKIYYAVKACPNKPVLELLNKLGSNFDCASIFEIEQAISYGIDPKKISFGNTIKKAADIKAAYEKGVRLFATDSHADLKNIARYAPKADIFVRILVPDTSTAQWTLSRKFGCDADMAVELLGLAKQQGLNARGVSFHVGSQQRDVAAWDDALMKVKYVVEHAMQEHQIKLSLINLGGGFPARYDSEINPIENYANEIYRFLSEDYNEDELPDLIIEPGRAVVGEAGVLVSEVVLVSQKSYTYGTTWVYTDVGVFSGLIETVGEVLRYPIYSPKMENNPLKEVVLAGPTCDSMDIMYEQFKYQLPENLQAGDKLYWLTTGAYTASYASVGFNGFPALPTIFIE